MTGNTTTDTDKTDTDKKFIIAESGRCVACGLCLPYCPTYQLAKIESESPRGRISLLAALASEELAASNSLKQSLQHCLLCRACEKMCPSSVPFARLMDKGRYLHEQMTETNSLTKNTVRKSIDFLFGHPEWLRIGAYFVLPIRFLYRTKNRIKKDSIKKDSTRIKQKDTRSFLHYLPSVQPHKRWKNNYPADNPSEQIGLFLGCVSRGLDGATIDDAINVLTRIGYSVHIPPQQVCCGALSLHAGRKNSSIEMMKKNIRAFANTEMPIIHTASGCGSILSEYYHYLPDNGFSDRINEVCDFIEAHWPEHITLFSHNKTVLLHTPCSLEGSTAEATAAYRLLKRVTDIDLKMVNSPYRCCGASGTTMLTDYRTSTSLRDPVIEQVKEIAPDMVVSSNIGCLLHLAEGLRMAGLDIPVRHPVSLIADLLMGKIRKDDNKEDCNI